VTVSVMDGLSHQLKPDARVASPGPRGSARGYRHSVRAVTVQRARDSAAAGRGATSRVAAARKTGTF